MKHGLRGMFAAGALLAFTAPGSAARADNLHVAQLGPRPAYLVDEMDPSDLKRRLAQCAERPFFLRSDFSIGHRGAGLQFPEHTQESYLAAERMGAGIIECDVTITKDHELVCRHAQCDLHTTTNILATDLANKCLRPPDYTSATPFANVKCCTTDLTLPEFESLCGKMDASGGAAATTLAQYLGGTPNWRTDVQSTCGKPLSHKESIALIDRLGAKFTPELKAADPEVGLPPGVTQETYAQKLIDEYTQAGIDPRRVFAQSFNRGDILYWIANDPKFGRQAVYLDDRYETLPGFDPQNSATWSPTMKELADSGIRTVAPPTWVLLTTKNGKIVPSEYAKGAKAAGLEIITWTLERSGRLIEDMKNGSGGTFYYQSTLDAIHNDGDILVTLDVLAKQVGIKGIFSDWPATVTFYANCMGLR